MRSLAGRLLEQLKVNEARRRPVVRGARKAVSTSKVANPKFNEFINTVVYEITQGNTQGEHADDIRKFFTSTEKDLTLRFFNSIDDSISGKAIGELFLSNGDIELAVGEGFLSKKDAEVIMKNPSTMRYLEVLSAAFDENNL